jgi:hypothetical protein
MSSGNRNLGSSRELFSRETRDGIDFVSSRCYPVNCKCGQEELQIVPQADSLHIELNGRSSPRSFSVETLRPNPRTPETSLVRTDRDRAMILLGVLLTVFFLTVGYLSLAGSSRGVTRTRGPVKNPSRSELHKGSMLKTKNPSDGLTGLIRAVS